MVWIGESDFGSDSVGLLGLGGDLTGDKVRSPSLLGDKRPKYDV
jgi:hypothetical protein